MKLTKIEHESLIDAIDFISTKIDGIDTEKHKGLYDLHLKTLKGLRRIRNKSNKEKP